MRTLLRVQELDLKIEACQAREIEIPKQKGKFDIQRKRLAAELEEREKACKDLLLEQRDCEKEIEQKNAQIAKYQTQLLSLKKNEEYQAMLHEIDLIKKQIAIKEERIIAIMMETDASKARLDEDRKRISAELKDIDRQCAAIDAELAAAIQERKSLDEQRTPLAAQVGADLLTRYKRIRASKKTGSALVPLNGEVCSGCNMRVTPQIVNEVLAGHKVHSCAHCGRLLYDRSNFTDDAVDLPVG
ncbi:MAG: hypothetical protein HZB26_06780 [Candidatus Hydrogenedentes bacterium]|nr:hypothetical protein [Candidatus Hydrogenedentota bacterium]